MKRLFTIIVIYTYVTLSAIAQEKELKYDWNFGLGVTSGIVPTTEKTKTPIWLTFELGFAFWKHHQLTFDCSMIGGGKKKKIGEAVWYTEDHSGTIYVQIPTGVIPQYKKNTATIYRKYSQSCSVFSYQYTMKIGENFRLHLGPSMGTYFIDAFSKYKMFTSQKGRPELEKNEKSAGITVYGFGVGISAREAGEGFVDIRYRYLTGKGLEFEDIKTKGSVHQITFIGGLCWNKKTRKG